MFFGPLLMIALVVLSIVVIMSIARSLSSERAASSERTRSPREILDERFAKGEIDREDYEARRKMLGV